MKLLTDFISENSLLSPHQYGFRSNYSTVDQLLVTYNDVTLSLTDDQAVDLIFFDYAKAFDRVSHSVVLQKLCEIGVHPSLVLWIEGFLSSRTMCVSVGGKLSCPAPVTSGVPQGSVLGPTLFLIYINHVVHQLTCKYKLFADDIKLYFSFDISNSSYSVQQAQLNIDQLVRVGEAWGLELNVSKCACMRFARARHANQIGHVSPYKINNSFIPLVSSHKDLGIHVDSSLKFHSHILNRVRFASSLTSNILASTVCRDSDFILNVYLSHVRPLLEYGSSLWNTGYLGDLKLLERVQRRWTRAVRGLETVCYRQRLRTLNLFSLQGRLLRADLILVYKIFHEMCSIKPADIFDVAVDSRTRGHKFKVCVPIANLDIRKRFFSVRVVSCWNALGHDTVDASSIDVFKRLLCRDLGDALYHYQD